MDPALSAEALDWLRRLDTDSPVKPGLPPAVGARIGEQGLAKRLVEGGLQPTTAGRERLSHAEGSGKTNR